ncbi:MAG TPA: hypothetical protein VMQ62_06190 [Dongiaceae bacterium]|nr:hypothetical protein [Dongiaceae bacterium]
MKRSDLRRHAGILLGPILGLFYGLVFRVVIDRESPWFQAITLGYVFGVPLVMGYLSVVGLARPRWWQTTFLPWVAWLLLIAFGFSAGYEGSICIIIATPVALPLASIGGWFAILVRRFSRRAGAMVLALPLVLMPLESTFPPAPELRTVSTTLEVAAPRAVVWEQIREVRPIRPEEHGTSWVNRIGFPRPIEARLYGEGVGAVRHATFEGGVLFVETITAWDEGSRLAFIIKADTASIPPTTLDEHVTIGGRYFDVLDGEYRLEELPSGGTRIHLTSHHRLSTSIDFYAALWSDGIMRGIQERILEVIRHRCES